ncbi:putative membrane protein [anaerobic digester metagenome]
MQNWIIQIINQFGYLGILILILIENIFPPIPSEVILTFGGFLTTYTSMNIWGVIFSATIGSVLGAIILYYVGKLLKPDKMEKFINGKWGQLLHFKNGDVTRASEWFSRRGKLTVFFCRFIPVVRSLISIPAGIAQMNMATFLILTTIGTFIWNVVLVYLGAIAGASWENIVGYMNNYSTIAIIALAVIAIILFILYYKKRISKKHES